MSEDSTVFLAIYIITFLIGFPNAVLAFCSCIRKIHRKPIPIDIFMLNLTASDLVFLTFLPVKMKEAVDNMVWNMPYILCHINMFMFFLPFYSSGLFLTAISAERYVCVAFPVKYKNSNDADNITNKRHLVAEPQRCYSNFTAKQLRELLPARLSIVVVFFLLPLLICCFCYISLIHILMKCPLFKRQRKLRVVGLIVGTLLVFAISFAPYNASHIVGFIKKENPYWRIKTLMLSTLNACFDPIIFFCISKDMRRAIKICVKALCRFMPI
ncbi:free fatty acid receptor 3 [Sinocyclocheilus anshuiensis]|uniref:free fatty acid receptor 3 n=1 Tax=Sinocyclocheilus anshuiensis TaxID=1608454 RepID=UPI0007B97605|nr:PREDICTED: free fatty acid receptor 3-like [Sinocyclocheilus anshuiensis]